MTTHRFFEEIINVVYKGSKDNFEMNNSFQAGDKIKVEFVINNLSNYTYNYDQTSFEIFPKEDIVYNKLTDKPTDKSANIFTGGTVNENYHVNRTYNTALKALIPNSNKVNLTDELISEALKTKGYKGFKDYTKYLLDFYNGKYHSNYTKLNQFPDGIIREILGENDPYLTQNNAYEKAGIYHVTSIKDIENKLKKQGYNSIEEYILKYYNEIYHTNALLI